MSALPRPVVPRIRRQTGSFRLVGAAVGLGLVVGLAVHGVQALIEILQHVTLGVSVEHTIPGAGQTSTARVALALCAGALLITLLDRLTTWFRPPNTVKGQPVDAVEANALRGGRMSAWDGFAVVLPILASVGTGASVGTEAAVTQIGAVLASLVGLRLGLTRPDVRVLVGAGAAAAIAGAYRAPIAGMLYAFELVLGNYSKRILAPVGFAALTAVLVVGLLAASPGTFVIPTVPKSTAGDVLLALVLGAAASGVGVGLMLSVTYFERFLRRTIPSALGRRLAAACCLALIARRYPVVLGSGHAAVVPTVTGAITRLNAVEHLTAKGAGSASSLAGGFRGGLFSASLLLGALLGQGFAYGLALLPIGFAPDPSLCALIGMGAVGASVIGAPLAMTFLVVETTGGYEPLVAVAVGALTGSFMTDRLFGYSFATWRFQQRGLTIGGGQDVSLLAATPITTIIRPPKRQVQAGAKLDEVLRAASIAGGQGVAVHMADGRFIGLVDMGLIEIASAEVGLLPVVAADLLQAPGMSVTAGATLADLLDIFNREGVPSLAVVEPKDPGRLVGCVRGRDAFALASRLLEAQRRDDLGLI